MVTLEDKIKQRAKHVAFSFLGTMEIVVDVDDEGVISLNFECHKLTAESKFVWSKNYEEMKDSNRLTMETKGSKYVCVQISQSFILAEIISYFAINM